MPLPENYVNVMQCYVSFGFGSYMLHITGLNVFQKCINWWRYNLIDMVFSLPFILKRTFVLSLFSASFKIVIILSICGSMFLTRIQSIR